jgi:hypothetical protein
LKLRATCSRAHGYFTGSLWHIADVHFICEQNDLQKLSDEEAMEVFAVASEQFDGDVGISWPQLERAVRSYLQRKTILDGLFDESAESAQSYTTH